MRRLSKGERLDLAVGIAMGRVKPVLTDSLIARSCGITASYLSRRLAECRATAQQKADIAILSLQQAAE
jgi:hypothetical protein